MFDNLTTMNIFNLAIGAFLLLCGLATLFTHKIFSLGESYAKYTDESVRKASPLLGLGNMVFGSGLLASALIPKTVPDLFGALPASLAAIIAGLVIGIVFLLFAQRKLVKKAN